MDRKRFNQLMNLIGCSVKYAQPGVKGDAATLSRHQLGDGIVDGARFAEDVIIAGTHLIRADDQAVITMLGDGISLGTSQSGHQRLGGFASQWSLIHIGGGTFKGETELLQQGFAIARS